MKAFQLSLFLLLILSLSATAQNNNLVSNPSFENYDDCPQNYTDWTDSHNLLPGWSYASLGTPDFFHTCAKGTNVGVPGNFMGDCKPHTGKGYAGIFIFGESGYSEYLQSHLTEPLEAGKMYCVNFWYRVAMQGKFAVDRVDLFFAPRKVYINKESFLKLRPQVENPSGKMMKSKDSWALYSGIYRAKGGERFMLIGNFAGRRHTRKMLVTDKHGYAGKGNFSYYYVDDVSVREIEFCNECEGIPEGLAVEVATSYSSPTDYSATDGTIELKVKGGQPPYKVRWKDGHEGFKLENLPFGHYEYSVRDHYNCVVAETVTFFTAVADTTFSGGNTGRIELKIAGGKGPYKIKWSNGATENVLSNLSEGEYKYTVTDARGETIENTVVFSEFSNKLKNINEGDAIVLDNIFFQTASIELLPSSYVALDKIVDFFNESGVRLVEVSGHTDSTGSKGMNMKISEGRAKTVVDYLVENGVDKERITYVGKGPAKPVASNASEVGRQKNRRVEFKVVKK